MNYAAVLHLLCLDTRTLSWRYRSYHSSITVTTPGTYSVTQTVNGCTSSAGTGIAAPSNQQASCTISGNGSICGGQSTSLCAPSGNASYKWNTGATTSCITVTAAGTYSLMVTSSSGCTCTNSKCVTIVHSFLLYLHYKMPFKSSTLRLHIKPCALQWTKLYAKSSALQCTLNHTALLLLRSSMSVQISALRMYLKPCALQWTKLYIKSSALPVHAESSALLHRI